MRVRIKTFNGELPEYLTADKDYEIWSDDGYQSLIFDDNGEATYISLVDCSELNGGSWEVDTREIINL